MRNQGSNQTFETAVTSAVNGWEQRQRVLQQDISQISSALEGTANSMRLLLTDAARTTLQERIAAAVRRGEELETAVGRVLQEWHKQIIRRQMPQTVWDPSRNSTRKVTGVVRFMPFKKNADS